MENSYHIFLDFQKQIKECENILNCYKEQLIIINNLNKDRTNRIKINQLKEQYKCKDRDLLSRLIENNFLEVYEKNELLKAEMYARFVYYVK